MLSLNSIYDQVRLLLEGSLSLDDFEDWLVSSSWSSLDDAEVRALVGAIELRLAEHSDGHLDEAELMSELGDLVAYGTGAVVFPATFLLVYQPDGVTLTAGTNSDYEPVYRPSFPVLGERPTSPVTRTASGRSETREAAIAA